MAWLRETKAQSLPAFPASAITDRASGPVDQFWAAVGGPDALYPEPNFVNNADYGFTKNELVYACIMEKATSLPDAPFRVFGPDGKGEPREDHPLRQLIANPNPVITEFELIELTSIYMDLAGIAFWEIVRDRAGRPTEIWPLRPDMVVLFPRSDHYEYGYRIGGGKVADLGTDVVSFRYPSPMSPPLGQAPMRAANRAVALDNEATDFVKSLLQNHAVPGVVIEMEQKIDEPLVERLTAKWLQRFSGHQRGQPAFLQKGMKIHTLGLDLQALEFPDLRTISESRICMSFGVPPILVGAKVGLDRSTFANYAEARRSFWEETLLPIQKRLQQQIVKTLMPMVETGPRPRRSVARFDNSEVLALRESEQSTWETALNALRAGGITISDFRRRVGQPPIGPEGDVFLIPAGVQPTADPSTVVAQGTTPTTGTGNPDDQQGKALERYPDHLVMVGDAREAEAGQGGGMMWWETNGLRDIDEPSKAMARDVAAVVRRQRDEFLAEGEKAHASWALRGAKSIPWDEEKWDRELADAMEPHTQAAAKRGGTSVDPDEPTRLMHAYVEKSTANAAHNWNEATRLALDAAVVSGGPDVLDNVTGVFALAAAGRAAAVSSSMIKEMTSFAKVDTAKRVGHRYKTWRASGALDPRLEHVELDGETVGIAEDFSNGQPWPGGPYCGCDVDFSSTP